MPYIDNDERNTLQLEPIANAITSPGMLNYAITYLADHYLRREPLNYARINEVIGVLACAQQEFYRRVAVPYEDEKMRSNGDVFGRS